MFGGLPGPAICCFSAIVVFDVQGRPDTNPDRRDDQVPGHAGMLTCSIGMVKLGKLPIWNTITFRQDF